MRKGINKSKVKFFIIVYNKKDYKVVQKVLPLLGTLTDYDYLNLLILAKDYESMSPIELFDKYKEFFRKSYINSFGDKYDKESFNNAYENISVVDLREETEKIVLKPLFS